MDIKEIIAKQLGLDESEIKDEALFIDDLGADSLDTVELILELEEQFDEQLGETEFVWEERTKVQTIAFSVAGKKVWITIDRNVIRSEILRIIDSCLPIVKRYS